MLDTSLQFIKDLQIIQMEKQQYDQGQQEKIFEMEQKTQVNNQQQQELQTVQISQQTEGQHLKTYTYDESQNKNQQNIRNQEQQQKVAAEEDLQQTVDDQIAGYHVIGEDSTNQVLQVNLYPKERIFVRGKILYANFDYTKKDQQVGYQTFSQFLKEFIASGFHPLRKIHNIKPHICYVGISKGGGKLLSIESDVYGDDIYVNPARIILSNVYHGNCTIKKHPNLSRYQNRLKINVRNNVEKTLMVVQSLNNNIIVEKYLGPKQKLYVQQRLILGLSGSVKGKASIGGLMTAKLQGPGWVFMQNDSNSWMRENKLLIMGLMMILMAVLTQVFAQQIQ